MLIAKALTKWGDYVEDMLLCFITRFGPRSHGFFAHPIQN